MILLIEYYRPSDGQRESEYLTCIKANLDSKIFEKIIVFIDNKDTYIPFEDDTLEIVYVNNRLTYSSFFKYCNENFNNDICVVSNTDIIFDDTLYMLNDINLTDRFYCLTRWDLYKVNLNDDEFSLRFFDVDMSQDCWIFNGNIKEVEADFFLGKPGCDNRIAMILQDSGYAIYNPSRIIIAKHLHTSSYRTYTQRDVVVGPYLLLTPNDNIDIPCDNKVIATF